MWFGFFPKWTVSVCQWQLQYSAVGPAECYFTAGLDLPFRNRYKLERVMEYSSIYTLVRMGSYTSEMTVGMAGK
jgi:hypothetical protein